ncbi:MAG: hypothetical protein A3H93_18335 [Rhodocyclales bacterium RIFCSPLOWO2_02_FULL_63_24]|nr:MAG: hypothetical protein A2040_06860 [Rhodocyclales bacterium GWA2_65_19]OHC67018.1 MAG: hypothetical protein A3H93_18335 [Rhodocyclales bacterium RIFCSPLOWO2_02_FULL_63_24]
MDAQALLIFDLDGARFAVDATCVLESIWLPELTPVEQAPSWIVGVFSLRGRIVPVIDLRLRFGHPARPYSLGDRVVVLATDRVPVGIIVSDVIEVVDLPRAAIQAPPQFDGSVPGSAHLLAGEARVGDGLVSLLDVARLTCIPEARAIADAAQAAGQQEPASERQFCAEATADARALFRVRAQALRDAAVAEEGDRLGLAVIEVGGEKFGVELASVREFCNVVQISPIPCCPPHIRGAINLRGDLVILIDPRAALNLPTADVGGNKAVIGTRGEQPVGIVVDDVHDVVYLRAEELRAPPPALRESGGAEIKGAARYAEGMMTVLDLPALLAREEWVVDEKV